MSFWSFKIDCAVAGLCTCTPLSRHRSNNHLQNSCGSICAEVPSRVITSMVPSPTRLSHFGPLCSSSQGRLWFASCALLVPLSSQSSPVPFSRASLSWLREIPVDLVYPQFAWPEFVLARCAWSLNESAPSDETEGANPCRKLDTRCFDVFGKRAQIYGLFMKYFEHIQSATKNPAARPEAQWNSSGLESTRWMLLGSVFPVWLRK